MLEPFDDLTTKGSLAVITLSILAILISGLFFGLTYYVMDNVETTFQNTHCTIQNNVYVDNCQDLWGLSIYPFLGLRSIFIWANFFFIFALSLGLLVLGYKSGKSPILLGLLVLFTSVLTYIGIEISNIYRSLIEIDIIRDAMIPFTVYNNIMLRFPWFVFIITLLSVMLGIVNFQRTRPNNSNEVLDY